jgi:cardiolipin synthase
MGPFDTSWIWVLVLLALVVLLGIAIWSIKRHRDPELTLACDRPLQELLPSVSGLTHSTLMAGNAVELLENGAFFDALFEEIAAARQSLHFETFLWKEGRLGARLAAALAERARAGVQVRVLLDARGCSNMGEAAGRTMAEAGCRLVRYHAPRLHNLGVLNRRDHRKACILDGRVALVGGHCIVDQWLYEGMKGKPPFHDLGLRLRGPGVHAVQSAFSENWVAECGELFVGEDVFPPLEPVGDTVLHVARAKPERAAPAVKILHHLILCMARQRLWIQNPYFLPQDKAIKALAAAVRRGVDVRVMVPAAEASDMPVVQHAAHHNFERLLTAGVRLFEYPDTLLHQKVLTMDGAWCAIGSSNFDDRSFEINDEITLGLLDRGLARQLEEIFERDMRCCVELDLAAWRQRGTAHRLMDRAFHLLKEQL